MFVRSQIDSMTQEQEIPFRKFPLDTTWIMVGLAEVAFKS